MRMVKRIFICTILIVFLTLCATIFYNEFKLFNVIEKIKEDATLLIPIHLSFFGVFSLLFNLEKFKKNISTETKTYKILRIGDTVFCLSLFISLIVFIYYTAIVSANNKSFNFYVIRALIFGFFVGFCILLYADNLKFHKTQLRLLKQDFIDDIGQ